MTNRDFATSAFGTSISLCKFTGVSTLALRSSCTFAICNLYFCLVALGTSCLLWTRSSFSFLPERLIGIFWIIHRNLPRTLSLYSKLQCTVLTFVSNIGNCNHPVARACRGNKNHLFGRADNVHPRALKARLVVLVPLHWASPIDLVAQNVRDP